MSKETKWAICVGMGIAGLFMANYVLRVSGSMYPMLDAYNYNPRYSPELHGMMPGFVLVWWVVCGVIGHLWTKDSGGS